METISVRTDSRSQMIDVTDRVQLAVDKSKVKSGACLVFVAHTTAGVTINENADPSVRRDILGYLDRAIPQEADWEHGEGNSPGHLKASLMGASVTVPVDEGRLVLGTWQGIYLCEFDGPRSRKIQVQVLLGRES